MSPERRKEIASKGGKTARDRGTANRFDSESASRAGRIAHQNGRTTENASEYGKRGGAKRKQMAAERKAASLENGDNQ